MLLGLEDLSLETPQFNGKVRMERAITNTMRFSKHRVRILDGTWRPWFAWYPVRISRSNGKDNNGFQSWIENYVWLEWIEHNGYLLSNRDYRLPQRVDGKALT